MQRRIAGARLPALLLLLCAFPVHAQNQGLVVRDGSLGAAPAGVVGAGLDPRGQPASYLITPDLGEQRGGNLFHSFERFGIGTGEVATFTGPDPVAGPQSVENIISRVTGSAISEIDGTLRSTVPGASVYLLNPNGLVFGETARVDVQGAFHASSADELRFPDGAVFAARADAPASRLTVAPPSAFGFLDGNTAAIRVHGELRAASLSLRAAGPVEIGGQVVGDDHPVDARVWIQGGSVRVEPGASVAALSAAGARLEVEAAGAVSVAGELAARGGPFDEGGTIRLRGGSVSIEETARVDAAASQGNGGHVEIEAAEAVTVAGTIRATSFSGDAGVIAVRGETLGVEEAGRLVADALRDGDGGRIELAGHPVRVRGSVSAAVSGSGTPGAIVVDGELEVDSQERVERDGSLGDAPAGPVRGGAAAGRLVDYWIPAELGEQVGPNLFHSFARFGVGPGETATFTGSDPVGGPQSVARIVSRVTGGAASEIEGTLRSTIPGAALYLLNPAGVLFGAGARLDVPGSFHASTADRLRFADEALFEVGLGPAPAMPTRVVPDLEFGAPNAAPIHVGGQLEVPVDATLALVGDGPLVIAGALRTEGARSRIALRGGSVSIEPSGWVGAASYEGGDGGEVAIEASGAVTVAGGVSAAGSFLGHAGAIRLRGDSVSLDVTGQLDASVYGAGPGGRIEVDATGAVAVAGSVSAESFFGGGVVALRGGALDVEAGGRVTASSLVEGDGGRIELAGHPVRVRGEVSATSPQAGMAGSIVVDGALEIDSRGLVERDGSLGDAPAGPVRGGAAAGRLVDYWIPAELGEQVGPNLFHSFARFGVGPGETATFTGSDPVGGPQSVARIVSRVTGGAASEIDGTLRSTIPGAALYLLNPAGVLFGAGARLDVPGSFHASTADRLRFADEALFEVGLGPALAMPTLAVPDLEFGAPNAAPIHVGGELQVQGDALSLVGDGPLTVAGALRVAGPAGAGALALRGGSVNIAAGAELRATRGSYGGRIAIDASGPVTLAGKVDASGLGGDGGLVALRGASVTIEPSGRVSADASGDRDGGRIELAGRPVHVEGRVSAAANTSGRHGVIVVDGFLEASSEGRVERDGSIGAAPAGPVSALLDPRGGLVHYWIPAELGEQVGPNLFHSFARFGVGPGETATFTGSDPVGGPQSVARIVSRVTGGAASEIEGTLRSTIPGAALYLLNPAGVLFGAGARLDLLGSFHASTADRLRFADEALFEVGLGPAPATPSLAVPELEFGAPNAAPIRVDGALRVQRGSMLALVGDGPVTIEGSLLAEGSGGGGEIALRGGSVSIAPSGRVSADAILEGRAGSVRLEGRAVAVAGPVSASGVGGSASGGSVVVEGEEIRVSDSRVTADGGFLPENSGSGGEVRLAGGRITLLGGRVGASAQAGDAGSVRVDARELRLEGGGAIDAAAISGRAGVIEVRASDLVFISNLGGRALDLRSVTEFGVVDEPPGGIFSASARGAPGRVRVEAPRVEIRDAGFIAGTTGLGRGGDVDVLADRLVVADGSAIDSSVALLGRGGNIHLVARDSLELSGASGGIPSRIRSASGQGAQAGNIRIDAGDGARTRVVRIDGGVILTVGFSLALDGLNLPFDPDALPSGRPGSVEIVAEALRVQNGGRIDSSSFGSRPEDALQEAGRIRIDASGLLSVSGPGSEILAKTGGTGAGGAILLDVGELRVEDGGAISAESAAGLGRTRPGLLDVIEAGLAPGLEDPQFATGDAGSIEIEADAVALRGGGRVSTFTESEGAGGRILVRATGPLTLEGGSRIDSDTTGSGAGGDVLIAGSRIELQSGAVSATSTGSGNAGTVELEAEQVIELVDSAIGTDAVAASGGNVGLRARERVELRRSVISASVASGNGGSVSIDPRFVLLDGSRIVAQASEGRGGRITIVADTFLASPDSVVSASAGNPELSGTVEIRAPEADIASTLTPLTDALHDPALLLRQRCAARTGAAPVGRLVATSRDRSPPAPSERLPAAPTAAASAPPPLARQDGRAPAAGAPFVPAAPCS